MADEQNGVAFLVCYMVLNDTRVWPGLQRVTFHCDVACAFNGGEPTTIPCIFFADSSIARVVEDGHVHQIGAMVCDDMLTLFSLTFMSSSKVCASSAMHGNQEFTLMGVVLTVRSAFTLIVVRCNKIFFSLSDEKVRMQEVWRTKSTRLPSQIVCKSACFGN